VNATALGADLAGDVSAAAHAPVRGPMRRLLLVQILGTASFFLTLASVPAWAVQGGAQVGAAGVVTTAMLAATVAVQFTVPALSARIGVRRALPASLLLLGAPCPLLAVSHGLGWLISLSIVRGAGFAIFTVVGTLVVTEMAGPGRRGAAIGLYGVAGAGASLVVPAGVALTLAGHFPWVAGAAAIPVLAVPISARFDTPLDARASNPREAVAALRPSAAMLVAGLAGGGLVTFLPIVRPSGQLAAEALLAVGLATAAGRLTMGLIADRVAAAWPARAAIGLAATGLLAVAAALGTNGAAAPIAAAACFGAGFGAVQNLTLLSALHTSGGTGTAAASAVWNAAIDAGTGLGALVVGLGVASGLGLRATLVVCAALVAATAPLVDLG
jgi:predicted MFS family arabinose efflux permease